MNNKVKLVIAIVLLLVAVAAIGYYFAASSPRTSPTVERLQNPTEQVDDMEDPLAE